MWSKIIGRFGGAVTPSLLNLSPGRYGVASRGDHAGTHGRGRPSLWGIIASSRLGFHPGNTCISTTKTPDAARDVSLAGEPLTAKPFRPRICARTAHTAQSRKERLPGWKLNLWDIR